MVRMFTRVGRAAPALCGFALVASTALAQDPRTPQPVGEPTFVERVGVAEFSGRLIVRPIQQAILLNRGLAAEEVAKRQDEALATLSAYALADYVAETDEYIIQVPAGSDENGVATALMATRLYQYAEPDWILYPVDCPNDTFFSSQWHHSATRMQSCDAWTLHTGNPTTSVGICDTGVLTTHQDLQLHRLEGYNAVDQLWESQGGQIGPVHPHGTQTTGCAAANGNNGLGVAGTGWNLGHRMMRVSNVSTGSASMSVLQHAARTAVENGSRVASVSYSGADSSSNLTTATYIKSIGGLLIWAAGNENRNMTLGNRDNDDLIVVGATDSNDAKASFSNYGVFVDLVAPGVGVATTNSSSNSSYASVNGTSFSCPLTAGLAALVWSQNPALTPDEVEDFLKQGSEDLGTAGVDSTYGYGRINSYNSLVLAGGGGITDCNNNGVDDADDIANGTSDDCNGNAVPDECDISGGTSGDCNGNTIPDECDISGGAPDCNGNGVPDACDISGGASEDCNTNGVPDECDIASGFSDDANGNGVPDECDPPPGDSAIWMTFEVNTTIPGVGTAEPRDIVAYDEAAGTWSVIFDGSDVGLGSLLIDGMARLADGSILLSFTAAATISGAGSVDDSDIVRFVPTSLGTNTAGTFSLYFDGSDVGLTTNNEDIDAITVLPDGRLVLSMLGSFSVSGASGEDEDLVVFNATSLGSATAGSFAMYFDGSDVGLSTNNNEDVDGIAVLPSGELLLTTLGSFSVSGASGNDEDLFRFTPSSLGGSTSGSFAMRLDLSLLGITNDVKDIEFVQ
ncbi:MAG: hypothetical protein AMXMBFR47_06710 [Planctomycetota bacterium]